MRVKTNMGTFIIVDRYSEKVKGSSGRIAAAPSVACLKQAPLPQRHYESQCGGTESHTDPEGAGVTSGDIEKVAGQNGPDSTPNGAGK